MTNFIGYIKLTDGTSTKGMCGFCRSSNIKVEKGITSCKDCGTVNPNSRLIGKGSKKIVHDTRGHFSSSNG